MSSAAAPSSTRPYLKAASAFAAGNDTPRAFLERCLAVIDEREADIGAFVDLDVAGARKTADAAADRWRSGRAISPIDGMPLGIKDIIETIDMPTGMGSPLFEGWRSGRDAASVKALREAGAIIVGKTVTTEFAATQPGKTRNPHDRERTPGGSSSGSAAAVGCGMLSAALGTQVIGSIIRPAGYCGCIGFKPTVHALNRGGSHDYMSQSAIGVLGADLADTWQVAREIAARCGGDAGYQGLSGPMALPKMQRPARLALVRTAGWPSAPQEAIDAFSRACDRLALVGLDIADAESDPQLAELESAIEHAQELSRRINAWESRWPLNTYRDRDFAKLSPVMEARLEQAEAMFQEDYGRALAERDAARRVHALVAGHYDAAITLSAPDVAPLGLASTGDATFAVPASLLGVPALSLPLLRMGKLPLGLQIIGFAGADENLFSLAAWLSDHLN
ncbi:amidase [Rhizobium sp. P32RR-XVIII]|uniref:amidase n=1 Tax=Rhizobium sp. P32RR-XVIII TaxID=2726738 RepID=UPI00145777B1|nr:amidase [Rhizobium sp. P32RR-XVIII]NLS06878.1 amidase [Rhizobium sp. P32RR-XVIII]